MPGWVDDLSMVIAELRDRLAPMFRRQLERSLLRPMREQTEHGLEIVVRVEALDFAGGDQRAKGCVPSKPGLVLEVLPVVAPADQVAQLALAMIVVDAEA